jgi:hypothetical protein
MDHPGSIEASGTDEGRYVYCVVRSPHDCDFGSIGIDHRRVYTIRFRDLAAVVSDAPPRALAPDPDHALAHERVLAAVMREFTIIPMAFGTIFRSGHDVAELLRSTCRSYESLLEQMHDRLEYRLEVHWDRAAVVAAIENEDEVVRSLRRKIDGRPQESSYVDRMRLGRQLGDAIARRASGHVAEIDALLSPLARARRDRATDDASVILDASYLVDRSSDDHFRAAVRSLAGRSGPTLALKLAGPGPPYSFVNVSLPAADRIPPT